MDVQAELANAIKMRYTKINGVSNTIKKTGENGSISRRKEPIMSEAEKASRSKSKKAAAAALLAKMGNRQAPLSFDSTTTKKSVVANGTTAGSLPLKKMERDTAERYRKMIKMGLPEDAVRHKMMVDGIPSHLMGALMSGEEMSPSKAPVLQKLSAGTSKGTSSLSLEEDKIAEKYRKMANIGLPKGAVLHKMISDGVSQKIQDAVMVGEPSSAVHTRTATGRSKNVANPSGNFESNRSSLSVEEEKIAAQYRTMIKIRMPEGAVRHKMTSDGVSTNIQDSVLAGEIPQSSYVNHHTGPIRSERSSLSPEEEKIATQYRTMIKIKMPEGVVRHKMIADGVPASIQDSVLSGGIPAPSSPSLSSLPSSSEGETNNNISSLSREDEMTATPYRKMMKMGMPKGAVKHKMTRDGISASIQNSVLREEIPSQDSLTGGNHIAVLHTPPPANPLTAAITSSGGIRSLKKAPVEEKKMTATLLPSNPLAAAIASTGGIKSLKRTAEDEKTHIVSPPPSNPLAAAIASSGGIRSLKKSTANEKKNEMVAMPSNPLAATIASSGGMKLLKKTSNEKTKRTTAAAVSSKVAVGASFGQSDLKKKSNNKNFQSSKKGISTDLFDQISSGDLRAGLKKNPEKSPEKLSRSSIDTPLTEELSSVGFLSSMETSPQKSEHRSPDVSTNASLEDENSSKGSSLQEDWPEDKADEHVPRGHLSGVRVKAVRSPKESFEGSNHESNKNYPQSHLSGIKIKSVRSKDVSPNISPRHLSVTKGRSERSREEFMQMITTETNQVDFLKNRNDNKTKRIRESPERGNCVTNKNDSQKYPSGIKVKSTRSPEEPLVRRTDFANEHIRSRYQEEELESKSSISIGSGNNDPPRKIDCATNSMEEQVIDDFKNRRTETRNQARMKSRRSHQEKPIRNNSGETGSKKSRISFQSTTKGEDWKPRSTSNIQYEDIVALEESFAHQVKENIKGQLSKTSDYSQRSRSEESFAHQVKANIKGHLSRMSDYRQRSRSEVTFAYKAKTNIKGRLSKTSDYSQRSRSRQKEPNSKVKNLENTRNVTTTADGVDHHCHCNLM